MARGAPRPARLLGGAGGRARFDLDRKPSGALRAVGAVRRVPICRIRRSVASSIPRIAGGGAGEGGYGRRVRSRAALPDGRTPRTRIERVRAKSLGCRVTRIAEPRIVPARVVAKGNSGVSDMSRPSAASCAPVSNSARNGRLLKRSSPSSGRITLRSRPNHPLSPKQTCKCGQHVVKARPLRPDADLVPQAECHVNPLTRRRQDAGQAQRSLDERPRVHRFVEHAHELIVAQ